MCVCLLILLKEEIYTDIHMRRFYGAAVVVSRRQLGYMNVCGVSYVHCVFFDNFVYVR